MADKIFGPKYIGAINLGSLRGFILDNAFTAKDTILLHTGDMDGLQLEYRNLYRVGMPDDFEILGVYIDEDPTGKTPAGRVVAILGDEARQPASGKADTSPGNYSTLYRCGYCGGLVDSEGEEIAGAERTRQIGLLNSASFNGKVEKTHGRCCR